jgi:hypothetical protein
MAANGQLEDHREDIPYLVGGFAGPGRLQDPHHVNVVNHGTVDYRPLPINVSNSHLSGIGPSYDQRHDFT